MLMSDHMTEIDHIIHDLEQIERLDFDDGLPLRTIEHTRLLAKHVLDDFMDLLRNLETEEFEHSGIIYDTVMIEQMCYGAYYMSRFGHENLFNMSMTLEETCEECARIIGCNPEALMHMKSNYDAFFENIRLNRDQTVVLNSDMIRVMKACEALTEEEAALECRMWFRR